MAQNGNYIQPIVRTRKSYFIGFNTVDNHLPPYTLTNVDIIKRDLLNHFSTPIGSRVMLPTYGTNIYDYLFNPFDEYTKSAIIEEAMRVVEYETRVELVSVDAFQENQTLTVIIDLLFKPDSVTDSMVVSYNLQSDE